MFVLIFTPPDSCLFPSPWGSPSLRKIRSRLPTSPASAPPAAATRPLVPAGRWPPASAGASCPPGSFTRVGCVPWRSRQGCPSCEPSCSAADPRPLGGGPLTRAQRLVPSLLDPARLPATCALFQAHASGPLLGPLLLLALPPVSPGPPPGGQCPTSQLQAPSTRSPDRTGLCPHRDVPLDPRPSPLPSARPPEDEQQFPLMK